MRERHPAYITAANHNLFGAAQAWTDQAHDGKNENEKGKAVPTALTMRHTSLRSAVETRWSTTQHVLELHRDQPLNWQVVDFSPSLPGDNLYPLLLFVK
jgi:hypothetical protein